MRLLCQLAYEDALFERATDLILLFAETEVAGERNNSVVGYMKQLFSLYLSGTEATPSRRQAYVAKLFCSSKQRHREIAEKLLQSAFQSSHWTSFSTFDFGARRRGSGWCPSTYSDQLQWYCGFISILADALGGTDQAQISAAKKLLAGHFRGLWTFARCFDALEEVLKEHSRAGSWPDMWIAIKNTIHFDGERHTPQLLERLKSLEVSAAPKEPVSEIEAYVLCNTWEHAEVKGGDYSKAVEEVNERIIKLGEIACSDLGSIEQFGGRLWEKHIDSLWTFGQGLARGSQNKAETFEFLVASAEKASLNRIHPGLLGGFIHEVHKQSPFLARTLQEALLEQLKLQEHLVYLLCVAPLEPWSVRKLIEIARSRDFDASPFAHISLGRIHEAINDDDLAVLIDAIAILPKGISTVLQILDMRFFIDKDSDYRPNGLLLSSGRRVIKLLMATYRDEDQRLQSHSFDRVCCYCLGKDAPISEVSEIVELVLDGIESYRLHSFDLGDLLSHLVKNFPELVLDGLFVGGESEDLRCRGLFRDRFLGLREASLNDAPIERLLAWCGEDQGKLNKLSELLCPFTSVKVSEVNMENPREVKISDHMMAILNAVNDKTTVVETIFARIWPSGWSGSLANILEVRASALEKLSEYPSPEVHRIVTEKLKIIRKDILKNRAREAEENNRREQRFE